MLYVEPQAGSAPVVQIIQSARRSVDLSAYFLGSTAVIRALGDAEKRGVRVKVMLDERPYHMNPGKVAETVEELKTRKIPFKWAPARFESGPGQHVFSHAKYVCNGRECEIGTANFDFSAFHGNREYLYVTRERQVVTAARDVFQADWRRTKAGAFPRQTLVLSPGSLPALLALLKQPGPLEVETEELGDVPGLLEALTAKGSGLWLILPANLSEADKKNAWKLAASGAHVRLLPTNPLYLHAKMIVGIRYGFVGSQNFSKASMESNREMGVVLSGAPLGILSRTFALDWRGTVPLDANPQKPTDGHPTQIAP
jgi:phosphatidylserine/phosphatidylglycerophosphate/cardiolipin synthase-like enzyme